MIYLKNCSPTRSVNDKTPLEAYSIKTSSNWLCSLGTDSERLSRQKVTRSSERSPMRYAGRPDCRQRGTPFPSHPIRIAFSPSAAMLRSAILFPGSTFAAPQMLPKLEHLVPVGPNLAHRVLLHLHIMSVGPLVDHPGRLGLEHGRGDPGFQDEPAMSSDQEDTHHPPMLTPPMGLSQASSQETIASLACSGPGPPARDPELTARFVYDVQVIPRKVGYLLLR